MVEIKDLKPSTEGILEEVLEGLTMSQKQLPCKLLYDRRGSILYDQICEADDYYPARTEIRIMKERIGEMAELIGPRSLLIEYGSGSSEKTRILLEHLEDMAGYVPIDISREHLREAAVDINAKYPSLQVLPVCADYTNHIEVPTPTGEVGRRVVYFPGSTIGNFEPEEAVEFLVRVTELCGPNDGALLGVDLRKDPAVLESAYDDSQGITAEFNLNILNHINSLLEADFDLDEFRHSARWNEELGRVEMHLVSQKDQTVNIDGTAVSIAKDETIWTESSYKHSKESFARLVAEAGFEVSRVWTDDRDYFSVQWLQVKN